MHRKIPPKWAVQEFEMTQKQKNLYNEALKLCLEIVMLPEGAVKDELIRIQNIAVPAIVGSSSSEELNVPNQALWAVQFAERVLKALGMSAYEANLFQRLCYLMMEVDVSESYDKVRP